MHMALEQKCIFCVGFFPHKYGLIDTILMTNKAWRLCQHGQVAPGHTHTPSPRDAVLVVWLLRA